MKIIKYKKTNKGRYKVTLDDGRELLLYEEVILKFELLLKKEISESELDQVNLCNQEWDVYYVALQNIRARFKSVYDLREVLMKKEYPLESINLAIDKLQKQGYLNDRSYAKSYINQQIITTSKGPNKIKLELLKHKVDDSIVLEELQVFDENLQLEKIRKIIGKLIKTNHTRGGLVLKRKIITDLDHMGYESSFVYKVLEEFDFSDCGDIAKKEYQKLYQRLSRKYEGKELEYKIREKLYQKGLYYEN